MANCLLCDINLDALTLGPNAKPSTRTCEPCRPSWRLATINLRSGVERMRGHPRTRAAAAALFAECWGQEPNAPLPDTRWDRLRHVLEYERSCSERIAVTDVADRFGVSTQHIVQHAREWGLCDVLTSRVEESLSTSSRAVRPRSFKTCGCGEAYTAEQYHELPSPRGGGDGCGLVWRNCRCGSTLAVTS